MLGWGHRKEEFSVEKTGVHRLARVLRVLVIITFVCSIIALLLVPGLAVLYVSGADISRVADSIL